MAMTVEPPAMIRELSMYRAMGAFFQMSMKLLHRGWMGKTVPLAEKISERLFRAVQNMAK